MWAKNVPKLEFVQGWSPKQMFVLNSSPLLGDLIPLKFVTPFSGLLCLELDEGGSWFWGWVGLGRRRKEEGGGGRRDSEGVTI